MWWRLYAVSGLCHRVCIDAVTLGLYCSLFVQETNFWPELDILSAQSHWHKFECWHKYLPLLMSFLAVLLFDFCQNENRPFLLWGFLTCSLSSLMCHSVNHPGSSDWPPLDPSCRVIKPGQTGTITQGLRGGAMCCSLAARGEPHLCLVRIIFGEVTQPCHPPLGNTDMCQPPEPSQPKEETLKEIDKI